MNGNKRVLFWALVLALALWASLNWLVPTPGKTPEIAAPKTELVPPKEPDYSATYETLAGQVSGRSKRVVVGKNCAEWFKDQTVAPTIKRKTEVCYDGPNVVPVVKYWDDHNHGFGEKPTVK